MLAFLARRLASGIVLLIVVTALTYFLVSAGAGDIGRTLVGTNGSPAQARALDHTLGLDRPLLAQYFDWLGHAVKGNLGTSYFTSEQVLPALQARLPVTLSVVLSATVLTVVFSLILALWAVARGGPADKFVQFVSVFGYALPGLVVAVGLVVVFSLNLRLAPATGYVPIGASFVQWVRSITLPATALTVGGVAGVTAQLRASLLDELGKDYVRTLRSRGVPPRTLLVRHVLRNALIPSLNALSLWFIATVGSVFFIERIYALPGFGTFAADAATQGDIPAIMGVVGVMVVVVIVVNLAIDLLSMALDPKGRRG